MNKAVLFGENTIIVIIVQHYDVGGSGVLLIQKNN